MVWVLVVVALLGVAVTALALLALRLRRRLAVLESRVASSDPVPRSAGADLVTLGPPDDERPEYVRVDATVFTDILVRESVVQAASLVHGLRRALAPETRNRIRFHMRAEVKRSRRQRRAELRDVRREWAARQRTQMAAQDPAA